MKDRETTTETEEASADLRRLLEETREAIARERERTDEGLRRIGRKIESLSSALGDGAKPAAQTTGATEQQVRSEEGGQNPKTIADRSKWSPKLRRLVETHHPEATKAERINRAKERPLATLGKRVPPDIARYYAEDADLGYDV